uniref:hypothetical protein n=1 Tax=Enterobacter hormaechei TaxID=158836 RepID=UPI001954F5E1
AGQGSFFGRRKGKGLRAHQTGLIETLLPRLIVDVADARLRLDSGGGMVELALSGKGMLTDGFAGMLRADATRLRISDCTLDGVAARMRIRIK